MGPGVMRKKIIEKSSYNCRIIVLILWHIVPYVFCMNTLLKVVSHCDLSICPCQLYGFPKRNLDRG